MGWTMGSCPPHKWGCGWIRGNWVSKGQLFFHLLYPHRCVILTTAPPPVGSLLFPNCLHNTTGQFPVVKQEQLSPRSSSSQADNMSTQGAAHDSAVGRGRWHVHTFLFYLISISSKLVLVPWCCILSRLFLRVKNCIFTINQGCCPCLNTQMKSWVFPHVVFKTVMLKRFTFSAWECPEAHSKDHTGVTWGQIFECTWVAWDRLKSLLKIGGEFSSLKLI